MIKHTFGKIVLVSCLAMLGFVQKLPAQTVRSQSPEQIRLPGELDGNALGNALPGDDSRFLRMNVKREKEHPRLLFGHLELKEHKDPPWQPQPPYYLQIHQARIDLHWRNP